MELEIVFEDEHYVAINKPFAMLSQADKKGEEGAFELLNTQLGNPSFLAMMQRLDRVAGGLMLFAKSARAAKSLLQQFEKREVNKTYWVVTEQRPEPPTGQLKNYLKKLHNPTRVRAFDEKVGGSKEAVLDYTVLATKENKALLEVKPQTGRMHQIRVQLAKIGCPIVGDKKYGKTKFLKDQSIALFSKSVEFYHPVIKEKLSIEIGEIHHPEFDIFEQ